MHSSETENNKSIRKSIFYGESLIEFSEPKPNFYQICVDLSAINKLNWVEEPKTIEWIPKMIIISFHHFL